MHQILLKQSAYESHLRTITSRMKADNSPRMSRQGNPHAKYLFDIFIYLLLVVFCTTYLAFILSLYSIDKIRYPSNTEKFPHFRLFVLILIN